MIISPEWNVKFYVIYHTCQITSRNSFHSNKTKFKLTLLDSRLIFRTKEFYWTNSTNVWTWTQLPTKFRKTRADSIYTAISTTMRAKTSSLLSSFTRCPVLFARSKSACCTPVVRVKCFHFSKDKLVSR